MVLDIAVLATALLAGLVILVGFYMFQQHPANPLERELRVGEAHAYGLGTYVLSLMILFAYRGFAGDGVIAAVTAVSDVLVVAIAVAAGALIPRGIRWWRNQNPGAPPPSEPPKPAGFDYQAEISRQVKEILAREQQF